MGEPFLAEIRLVGFQQTPKGWAPCNGQFLPINQNQALFALLGTNYGGNGQTNFALPDMKGRVATGAQANQNPGIAGGSYSATVTVAQLPPHEHGLGATTQPGNARSPVNALPAQESAGETNLYGSTNGAQMNGAAQTSVVGNGTAHNNLMPSLGLKFIIALVGIFPSPND